jgi:hypothetical protein
MPTLGKVGASGFHPSNAHRTTVERDSCLPSQVAGQRWSQGIAEVLPIQVGFVFWSA